MVHGSPGSTRNIYWENFEKFAEEKELKKYISEDFKIRFLSCDLGCGKKGEIFLNRVLGDFTYPENSGTAFASQVSIVVPGVPLISDFGRRLVELVPGGIFLESFKDKRNRQAIRNISGDNETPVTVPTRVQKVKKEQKSTTSAEGPLRK